MLMTANATDATLPNTLLMLNRRCEIPNVATALNMILAELFN